MTGGRLAGTAVDPDALLAKTMLKHVIEFFHLQIIPMTLYKDIMPYLDKFISARMINRNIADFIVAPRY